MFYKQLRNIFLFVLLTHSFSAFPQQKRQFNKYDYLHGKLTSVRSCFDVKQYEITIKVEPKRKYISGNNRITFSAVRDFRKLQLDLFSELSIDSITYQGNILKYSRDSNAVFIELPESVKKGQIRDITVFYRGVPAVARKAPWDGGFVWSRDSAGNDWVGLACEGLGASCWLPCKDHLSDEADSMKMHLIVPDHLTGVSNGKLTGTKTIAGGFKQFDWEVKNPINNYNITINAGDYAHIHDFYQSRFNVTSQLNLDYYVLKENKVRARNHFLQVKQMLDCFELYFGAYPFIDDGYKLVETPYWGMEHQSCISYGDNFENNSWDFDFIIVHESGHEWFGNSLSCNDPAEMWIHESFTTYAEALFVECRMGYAASVKYLNEQRSMIKSKEPMIGPFDVYYHGRNDNDIYYKGTWILNTMRSIIDNDSLWFSMLRELNFRYFKSKITTKDIIGFFNEKSKLKWDKFFDQYLYRKEIPVLEYKIVDRDSRLELHYRWNNTINNFDMPVKMTVSKGIFEFVTPTKRWQVLDLNYLNADEFKVQTDFFLVKVKKI